MKKIVRQQNYLKELIEAQENKQISRSSLVCIVRAVLEPLLDNPEIGVVLHRIINRNGLTGLIKRLEFSDIEAIDYSDESGNLREKVWANTEFICVMTHRFVSIILWDDKCEDKSSYRYYSLVNSKLQNEALNIIGRNSIKDIKPYQEKFTPDRRDNLLLNTSIRRLVNNIDELSKDAVLGFAEVQTKETEYGEDTRIVAHEIKNQLSICDLYGEIIRKYCDKNNIDDETIKNAVQNISKAIQVASSSLVSLKSINNSELKTCDIRDLVDTAANLAKPFTEDKSIEFLVENNTEMKVLVDENKFAAVLINLVKNAVEAFEDSKVRYGKYIKIVTEKIDEFGIIKVSNNAGKIKESNKIFEKGFTTKASGSGLGLSVCKKTIEEFLGQINLEENTKDRVEFVIKLGLI